MGIKREKKVIELPSRDLQGIAQCILNSEGENVVVMAGAGCSTSAGIPDFRSKGTGLYDNLQKYNLPTPKSIFSIDYFRHRPQAFYELAKAPHPIVWEMLAL